MQCVGGALILIQERKIYNMEIEIITFVVNGSAKLTVPN